MCSSDLAPNLRAHLEQMFADELRDTAKGRVQQPDGTYTRAQGEPFSSQEHFCEQSYSGAWALSGLPKPEKPRPKPRPISGAAAKPAPAAKPSVPGPKAPPAPRPAVKIQARKHGLLGRLLGRD